MSFPDRYQPAANFARDEQRGIGPSGSKMDAENARIAASITQLVTFLKRFTTADGRLKLDQAVRIQDVISTQSFDGDGVTTTFTFDQEIDSAVDLVRVHVDGVRTDPSSVTDTDFTMAAAPDAGSDNVVVTIYTNIAGVLDRMQSILFDEGAQLVGYADPEGKYTADNVQDALTEVKGLYDQLIVDLGDVGQFVLRDGSRTLTGQWELNERTEVTVAPAAAVGSFVLSDQPADGDYVELNDGNITQRFEFDDDASVTSGNILVSIGATLDDTLQSFVDAVNNSPLAIKASFTGSTVTLTHEIPYALGNQPIVKSGTNITSVAGMAGGVNGSFSAAFKTHYRLRNCPTSLRDGDVVVHEQLNQIVQQITAALAAFLRLDGVNQMVGPLNMGGNPIRNLLAATLGTDATNLTQVQALIAALAALKLSLAGTKDTPANGTLTGPVTLGAAASDVADADQTSTPASVSVHTIHGVPIPSADSQVTNKKYVDDLVAAAISPTDRPIPEIDFDGDGVGGGTDISSLNAGGTWYTEDLVLTAAVVPTAPLRLFVNGSFTSSGSGTITSNYPIEIEAIGDVSIGAAVQCPYITIRAGGSVDISAAITTHAADYTVHRWYPRSLQSRPLTPTLAGLAAGTLVESELWRLVRVSCNGDLDISAAITSDDILMECLGNLTVSSTLTAFWLVAQTAGFGAGIPFGWWDGMAHGAPINAGTNASGGGGGGTGGGAGSAGSSGVAGAASIYKGSKRPGLRPNVEMARGNSGDGDGVFGASTHSRPGGRILAYCGGDATLTGALFVVSGGPAVAFVEKGGGGAGSARVVAKGTITDGEVRANGGPGDAVLPSGNGGGGLAAFVASAYAGVQTTSAAAGTGHGAAQAGTAVSITLTADEIQALRDQGVFNILWTAEV